VDRARQAVGLWRLAAERSRGKLPGLAASAQILAACLNSAGRAEESLQAAWEAVRLYRELAAATPMAHAGRLAEALGALAPLLEDAGRRHEAENLFVENLAHFAEAPDVVSPILLARGRWRMSYGDLSAAIKDLGAAVQAADDAVDRSTRGQARRYLRHLRERDSSSLTAHGRSGESLAVVAQIPHRR
jgi:tetratricopeptide (TPR) repeat protein